LGETPEYEFAKKFYRNSIQIFAKKPLNPGTRFVDPRQQLWLALPLVQVTSAIRIGPTYVASTFNLNSCSLYVFQVAADCLSLQPEGSKAVAVDDPPVSPRGWSPPRRIPGVEGA
jgi:hypothetical protein